MFAAPAQISTTDLDDEKSLSKRYSTISPNMCDIGAQSPSNEHIDRMARILLTYNFFEKELGIHSSCSLYQTWFLTDFQDMCKECQISVHHFMWFSTVMKR